MTPSKHKKKLGSRPKQAGVLDDVAVLVEALAIGQLSVVGHQRRHHSCCHLILRMPIDTNFSLDVASSLPAREAVHERGLACSAKAESQAAVLLKCSCIQKLEVSQVMTQVTDSSMVC